MTSPPTKPADGQELPEHCTTLEAAKRLGLAVRSVQMMVDRGELRAWKTAGGHRRIALASVASWIDERRQQAQSSGPAGRGEAAPVRSNGAAAASNDMKAGTSAGQNEGTGAASVLIIEDSVHYQKMLSLLLAQQFPQVKLHIASDGMSGLAMCGAIRPDVLIVDILLPGIDGATLITGLRTNDHFTCSQLIVVTALDEAQREPYAFALQGVPVIHKSRLVTDLPPLLQRSFEVQRPASP